MKIKGFVIFIILLTCLPNVYSQVKTIEVKINDSQSFNYTAKELFEEIGERGLVDINIAGIEQVSSINDKLFQKSFHQDSFFRLDSIIKIDPKKLALKNVADDSLIFKVFTIWNDNSRVEAVSGPNIDKDLLYNANSVVCFINSENISKNKDGTYTLLPRDTYGKRFTLCPDEPYYNQPMISECTGVAIDKNLILTASHCIAEESLMNLRFVFNYKMLDNNKANLILKNDEVLIPEKIVSIDTNLDYAIIKVSGKIPGDRIAKYRETDKIPDQQSLYVIGTPHGLPIKIDTNGVVLENADTYYFFAAIDTFKGNSGSPIFNKETHKVEGILVEGDDDFKRKGIDRILRKKCKISVKCPSNSEDCNGEKVLRITQINLKKK